MRHRRYNHSRRSVFDKSEHMRRVQKEYKGPRGIIGPKELHGFKMGQMVEFIHPKTGERSYGKIVDYKRDKTGTVIAELSVKATLQEDGTWLKYPDFYDFQYMPIKDLLQKAPRGVYEERTRRRASFIRHKRKADASYGTKKLLEEIYNDKQLEKTMFDMLLNIATDADIEVGPELEEYEYAPGVVYLGEDMDKYFKQNYDLAGFGYVDWIELAQAFVDREKVDVYDELRRMMTGTTKRQAANDPFQEALKMVGESVSEGVEFQHAVHFGADYIINYYIDDDDFDMSYREVVDALSDAYNEAGGWEGITGYYDASIKRRKTMKRRQAAAEVLTYDPNYSGIGKFNSNIDEQVYEWSGEGWGSAQVGSADGFGYHELLEIPEGVLVKQPEGDWTFQAAILAEDNQGFVYVTYYDTLEDGQAAWAEVEADYEDYLDEVRQMNPDMDEDEIY